MKLVDHRKEKLSKTIGMEQDETLATHYDPLLRNRLGYGKKKAFPSCYRFFVTYGLFLTKDGSRLPGARVEIHHEILNLCVKENWLLPYIEELLNPKDKALDDLVTRLSNSFRAGVTRVS